MFHARGDRGRLLAVYADAAALASWTATTGDTIGGATRFEARITRSHDLLLRYRPLTIGLRFGDHEWRWLLDDLRVSDGTLQAMAQGAPVVFPA